MPHLFLCYSRKDGDHVDRLLTHLRPVAKRHGLDVFIDVQSIRTGDRWEPALNAALDASRLLVVAVSPGSLDSDWCPGEWTRAGRRGVPILPLALRSAWLPRDHALAALQFANKDAPLVVDERFDDERAAAAMARVDASLTAIKDRDAVTPPADAPPPA